ncbi:hypothetical protein M9H77_31340 [Catharanthus roseus]|uniref:Uncharacterized protein n=1 Tax=Catharanthus roseus TaxID=4058 RepID=A0ACC0A254_CATRO|nr:hypothetical protein M9H77_31340 [Catharanthus roseus]
MKFTFPVISNEMARSLKITHLLVRSDSQVVIRQVTGDFEAKEDNMKKYFTVVLGLTSGFQQIHFEKVPRSLNTRAYNLSKLSDNGKQFYSKEFWSFCEELEIEQRFTSVGYPQMKGSIEVTNKTILQGLKRRLDSCKGRLFFVNKWLGHFSFTGNVK